MLCLQTRAIESPLLRNGTDVKSQSVKGTVIIFPNPSKNHITIKSGIPGAFSVEMYSSNGQLIYQKKFNGDSHQIDLASYTKGIYLITVHSKDFIIASKVIKR